MRTVVLAGLVTALAGPAWSGTDDLFLRTRVTHHREGSVPSESTTYYAGDIVVADGPPTIGRSRTFVRRPRPASTSTRGPTS